MRKYFVILLCLAVIPTCYLSSQSVSNSVYLVDLSRTFAKDIFETNGVPFLEPMVQSINATSNSRFFNQAFVPSKVDKPYFRIGVHGMFGIVPNDKKSYAPYLPNEELTLEKILNGNYGTIDLINQKFNITDTAGLIYAIFKGMMFDGLKTQLLNIPSSAATIMGNQKAGFDFKNTQYKDTTLAYLLHNLSIGIPINGTDKLFYALPKDMQDTLDNVLKKFPQYFSLSEGANINYLGAGVPQFEIGSLYGTELLLRFIPPVDMGENIGNFAFWGIGLKHSFSQYYNNGDKPYERYYDVAFQIVYQGTSLKNKIGVTNAELSAKATMLDLNLQISKSFEGVIDIFGGLSREIIKIESDYKYFLPVELQWQLGLLDQFAKDEKGNYLSVDKAGIPNNSKPTPGFPGDTKPQSAKLELVDSSIKAIIGVAKEIGPICIFLDFNIGKINLFTGGIEYRF